MNDLISRQAALNCFHDWIDSRGDVHTADEIPEYNEIMELPSAQPEIVMCKDCKYNVSSHKCLHPESFFLVPDDDFYCGYAKRRTDG